LPHEINLMTNHQRIDIGPARTCAQDWNEMRNFSRNRRVSSRPARATAMESTAPRHGPPTLRANTVAGLNVDSADVAIKYATERPGSTHRPSNLDAISSQTFSALGHLPPTAR